MIFLLNIHGDKAVSYTHLDVYKRQADKLDRSLVINGDATDIQLLRDENVEESDIFVAVTEDDHFNVLSAILAKQLGAGRTITQLRMSCLLYTSRCV